MRLARMDTLHGDADSTQLPSRLVTIISWEALVGSLLLAAICQWAIRSTALPLNRVISIAWQLLEQVMPSSILSALSDSPIADLFRASTAGRTEPNSPTSTESGALKSVLGFAKSFGSSPKVYSATNAPKGLGNWDNSCYQNSILQALSSLSVFTKYLRNAEQNLPLLTTESTTSVLVDLYEKLNDTASSTDYLWTPAKLKAMSTWQQQDAQEYYSKLVDGVENELRAALRKGSAASLLQKDERQLTRTSSETHENSFISSDLVATQQQPVDGLLAQRVACTQCGYTEGLSLIPFNCITLPLGRSQTYSLEQCLDEYASLEFIEGVECAKCTLLQAREKLHRLVERQTAATNTTEFRHNNSNTTNVSNESSLDHSSGILRDVRNRLRAIDEALAADDFRDSTLAISCNISKQNRVMTTKSRQAVLMRPPVNLVLHINRSIFDEMTGAQLKNYADVKCPASLDISPWCIGGNTGFAMPKGDADRECWNMHPLQSMATLQEGSNKTVEFQYELKALVTHYGRHENGHYVCYRKLPVPLHADDPADCEKPNERWWRISDETVTPVMTEDVLAQGGAFMIFFERVQRVHNDESQEEGETNTLCQASDAAKPSPVLAETIPPPNSTSRSTSEERPTSLRIDEKDDTISTSEKLRSEDSDNRRLGPIEDLHLSDDIASPLSEHESVPMQMRSSASSYSQQLPQQPSALESF